MILPVTQMGILTPAFLTAEVISTLQPLGMKYGGHDHSGVSCEPLVMLIAVMPLASISLQSSTVSFLSQPSSPGLETRSEPIRRISTAKSGEVFSRVNRARSRRNLARPLRSPP